MADRHFIVATAGHVDHGKSALVRALTGTDPDRLPEEKARGITIELGFARLVLPVPVPSCDEFQLGIVDVPGHENFVKNMVAGVGSIDAALFVVAADDGWMPQSEEHLQILEYLGVRRAVVVLTKIDLVSSIASALDGVRGALRGSHFADAPIIPFSVVAGEGIEKIKDALSQTLADTPSPLDSGKPRLPIDRVFALRGVGTIVTGTLMGGTFRRGDPVIMQPSGRTASIRVMHNYGRETEVSVPGTRTALNLPELEITGGTAVKRGDVVTLPELGMPSGILDVLLTCSRRSGVNKRSKPSIHGAARPIKNGIHTRVYHGSDIRTARVSLLNFETLQPGGQAIARLHFEPPIFAFAGDRFIIRDGAERSTLAGGVVLDPEPGRRPFRRQPQRRFLEHRAAAETPNDPMEAIAAWLERDHAVYAKQLLLKSIYSDAQLTEAIERLVADNRVTLIANIVVNSFWWPGVQQIAVDIVDVYHHEHPEHVGLTLSQLRADMVRHLPVRELFEALVNSLVARGVIVRVGTSIRRTAHRPTLPLHLRAAGDQLRAALGAKPFEPPSRRELAKDDLSRQALRFLCDTGEALEFGDDVVLTEESYRRIKTIIVRTLRSNGPATASELRQVIGTTRRVLIPVLESLDRDGITRRMGDLRTVP